MTAQNTARVVAINAEVTAMTHAYMATMLPDMFDKKPAALEKLVTIMKCSIDLTEWMVTWIKNPNKSYEIWHADFTKFNMAKELVELVPGVSVYCAEVLAMDLHHYYETVVLPVSRDVELYETALVAMHASLKDIQDDLAKAL